MHNSQKYIERIKEITLRKRGIVLSDDEALETHTRLVELVSGVMKPQEEKVIWKKKRTH